MNVNVQFKQEDNVLHGYIEGEIDAFTAVQLREKLDAIVMTKELEIILDLSHVVYMDSTGLGVFVAFYKKTVKENAYLKLVGLSNRMVRLFDITGLSELMDIDSDKKVELSNEGI